MLGEYLDRTIGFVTDHNRIVLVVMLVLSAGMLVGITNLDTTSQAGGNDDLGDTTPAQKAEYIQERYENETDDGENVSYSIVYVRDSDGNVLEKDALLESLRYQQAVTDDEDLSAALVERDGERFVGVANLVARQLAGDQNADLERQIEALESASDEEVRTVVRETFADGSPALRLLPDSYEPGSDSATGHRMLFYLDSAVTDSTQSQPGGPDATRILYEEAQERDDPEYFTLGGHALADANEVYLQNTVELILPIALALILGVLAFTYRDPVDVVVGMTGVVLSVVWMFGILGWLGVAAGVTMIIGPVLIAGLSIDFGFHVFNRYREERGPDEGIREPMYRGVRSVMIALGLVTITAGIGFLSNLVNPLAVIRDLGVGITLGVVSAFVIFVTFVPALKVSIDGLLERFGLDRRKQALGHGAYLRRLLGSSVSITTRAAPLVIVIALVAGAGGAVAWTALDQESFQQQEEPAPEWMQNLPGPLAWNEIDYFERSQHVQNEYRSPGDDEADRSQLLLEGDVTADGTLDRIDTGLEEARERGIVFEQQGVSTAVSPRSVILATAERDEAFARTVAEADTNGDGVPDRNLAAVYDHLFDVAPEQASRVIERTDGEYRSVRVIVPVDRTSGLDERADDMNAAADAIEDDGDGLTVTAVGQGTIVQAELAELTEGILQTMVIALVMIAITLLIVYRLAQGSATLGAITVVPIALVVGFVVGGMYLLSIPLTLLTALLMSLVIGLGIDYNIHVSDRFAQEYERRGDVVESLEVAVTGTGGALLGSTLTSAGAFAVLTLHPDPQMTSFGTMVVLALVTAFVISVFVLPSMILVWSRYAPGGIESGPSGVTPSTATED